jgi:tRNA-dihydrouridine synthase B
MIAHYRAMRAHFGEEPGLRLARKHLAWYSAGLPGSAAFRATVTRLADATSVERLIDAFYDPLIEDGRQSEVLAA